MHTSILYSSFFTLALVLSCQATSYTYWVDTSCSNRAGFHLALAEAFKMGERASARLASSTDTDFANVFKAIFNVTRSSTAEFEHSDRYKDQYKKTSGYKEKDTAYTLVKSTMSSIGSDWIAVSSEADRLASDVRIYCDNGAHWSRKSTAKSSAGDWIDDANKMISEDKCEKGQAFTSYGKTKLKSTDSKQNDKRVIIDICDKQFDTVTQNSLWHYLAEVPATTDLTKWAKGIKKFNYLTSMVILHELTHTRPYLLVDTANPYGWDNVVAKSAALSVQNSDSYAYFGLWALLADRKPAALTKGGYSIAQTSSAAAAAEIKAGMIVAYEAITA